MFAIGFWRNDGAGAAIVQFRPQPVGVEGLVGQERVELKIADQRLDADHIVTLAGQEDEADQAAQSIHKGDDLGRQAASRASDGLIASPPFAPLAFW